MELQWLLRRYQTSINDIYRGMNIELKTHVHPDITTDQFAILQHLYLHDHCTSTQLADEFHVGKSAVTAIINRLSDKNLIKKNRDQKDRRIVYLQLNQDGEKLVKDTEKEIHRVLHDKLSHFTMQEIETFLQSLEKFASLMKN